MAARQTEKYGVAAVAIAIAIIAGAVVSMSPATTTSQSFQSSSQTTTLASSQAVTTIQLGTSSSVTSSQSSTTQGQRGSGVLSIYLTDAPPSDPTLKYLLVNVSSLEVSYQGDIATTSGTSSTTAASAGTQPQGVYVLAVPSNVGTNVNLSSLQGQSLLLGGANMPAGNITSIVLNVTGAKAFYTDGSTQQLKVVADGKLMVTIQFGLQADGSTDLTIDVTPNLGDISQGGVLTPVIHVTVLERGQSGTTTQTVTTTETLPPSISTVTATQTVTALTTVTATVTAPTTTTQTVTSTTTLPPVISTSTTTLPPVTTTTTLPPVTTTSTSTQTSTSTSTVTLPPTTTTTTVTENVTTTVTTTSSPPPPPPPPPPPASSTSVSCGPNPVQLGHDAECEATVTSPVGGLTGQVSFSSGGNGAFGSVGCNDNGFTGNGGSLVCNAKYTPSATGNLTITAAYSGDAHHSTSIGPPARRERQWRRKRKRRRRSRHGACLCVVDGVPCAARCDSPVGFIVQGFAQIKMTSGSPSKCLSPVTTFAEALLAVARMTESAIPQSRFAFFLS